MDHKFNHLPMITVTPRELLMRKSILEIAASGQLAATRQTINQAFANKLKLIIDKGEEEDEKNGDGIGKPSTQDTVGENRG